MNQLQVKSRFWIYSETGTLLGLGRIDLLSKIQEEGSLSKAAKSLGMSYKKAWGLINSINRQFELPLVITSVGGARGGGSALSEEGRRIVMLFKEVQEKNQCFLETELKKCGLIQ